MPHRELYDRVHKALFALPWEFETDINIVGIAVTDLYTFNSALGAAIEQSVVENLNKLRPVWDPDGKYKLYRFVRRLKFFLMYVCRVLKLTEAQMLLWELN